MTAKEFAHKIFTALAIAYGWCREKWDEVIWPWLHAYFSGPDHFFRRCVLYSSIGHFALFLILVLDFDFLDFSKDPPPFDVMTVELISDEVDEPEVFEETPPEPVSQPDPARPQQPPPEPTSQPSQPAQTNEVALATSLDAIPMPPVSSRVMKKPKQAQKPKPPQDFAKLIEQMDRQNILTRNTSQPTSQPKPRVPMSANEQAVLLNTFKKNWDLPPSAQNADVVVRVRITVAKSKKIKDIKVLKVTGQAKASLKKTIENSVIRAINKSSPLPVPDDKFEDWKVMNVNFDPKLFF